MLAAVVAVTLLYAMAGSAQAAWTVNDVTTTEGDSGTHDVTFNIRDDNVPMLGGSTVDWTIANGTAETPSDYTAAAMTGTASFSNPLGLAPDQTQPVTVTIKGDTAAEPHETFTVTLSNATGDTDIERPTGTGTINNDDAQFALAGPAAPFNEGSGGGTTPATFTITLADPVIEEVRVKYGTSGGAEDDYTRTSGTATFPAGTVSVPVTVPVTADDVYEADEAFTFSLSVPTAGTIAAPAARELTIVNDDPLPKLSVASISGSEGNSGTKPFTFTVSMDRASEAAATVKWRTSDGTATAPADYVAVPLTTLQFEPGETSKQITVLVKGDTIAEPNEVFGIVLQDPAGAALVSNPTALGGIVNDDAATGGGGGTGGGGTGGGTGGGGTGGGTGGGGTGGSGSDTTQPVVKLTKPKLSRGAIVVKITCPATEQICRGTLTTFTVANPRAKVRQLRKESKLGSATFVLRGGKSARITTRLSKKIRKLIAKARRVQVRSFAVAHDAAGNIGTANAGGTLKAPR